jgi:hypothetical protein
MASATPLACHGVVGLIQGTTNKHLAKAAVGWDALIAAQAAARPGHLAMFVVKLHPAATHPACINYHSHFAAQYRKMLKTRKL